MKQIKTYRNIILRVIDKCQLCFLLFLFFSCNNENASDCFQNAGDIIREELSVSNFTKITVFENIALVLKQGNEQKLEIETGEFLRNDVTATIVDGRLILRNENNCNYVRNYGLTIVYVTAPNITEIRSSTGLAVKSDGILSYQNLKLISEDFSNPEADTVDGSFNLEVAVHTISIVSNGIAFFKLSGVTNNLNINLAAGDSRVDAENLMADNVTVNHRASNDILVNPQQTLSGVIRSVGDVISFNRPTQVAIEELYKGKLIYKD